MSLSPKEQQWRTDFLSNLHNYGYPDDVTEELFTIYYNLFPDDAFKAFSMYGKVIDLQNPLEHTTSNLKRSKSKTTTLTSDRKKKPPHKKNNTGTKKDPDGHTTRRIEPVDIPAYPTGNPFRTKQIERVIPSERVDATLPTVKQLRQLHDAHEAHIAHIKLYQESRLKSTSTSTTATIQKNKSSGTKSIKSNYKQQKLKNAPVYSSPDVESKRKNASTNLKTSSENSAFVTSGKRILEAGGFNTTGMDTENSIDLCEDSPIKDSGIDCNKPSALNKIKSSDVLDNDDELIEDREEKKPKSSWREKAVSSVKKYLPSCKTETSADASAYELPSSFNSNVNTDDQHEEEGAHEDNLWANINTNEMLGYDDETPAPSFVIAPQLKAIIIKAGNIGKKTLENITAAPFTGRSCHSQILQSVNSHFKYKNSDSDDPNDRTVSVVNLVFCTMIQECPAMMMKEYCQILNDSYPCWYAQIFFLFIAEYVLSEKGIDLETMKERLEQFYADVFPLFHCKSRREKLLRKKATTFRRPDSLFSNSNESKKIDKLILGDLKSFLPKLAAKKNPMKYIRNEIVPIMLEEFNLNQIGKGPDKYFVLNRIVEQPHWFYKDYIKQLELAGLRPIIPFRLAIQQLYHLDGVTPKQHKRLLEVGLQHAKSNTGNDKGYVHIGQTKIPFEEIAIYITDCGIKMSNGFYITARRQKIWNTYRNLLKDYLQDNHGKYPTTQGTNPKLYEWVLQQRRELGPLLDTNVKGDAVKKERYTILKSDGFEFVMARREQAMVYQAVIKFSIIDGLFLKEYSTMKAAASQNNIKNLGAVSEWLGSWTNNKKTTPSLAYKNMIFRKKDTLPPYSSDYQHLDNMIKQKIKKIDSKYISLLIYSETNGKINHHDEVFKKATFMKRFRTELKRDRMVDHALDHIGPQSNGKGGTICYNRRIHDALKGKGILIEGKTYKYCEPQFIPNYFCFRDDKEDIAGVNAFDSVQRTKLLISGFCKIRPPRTKEQVKLRTAEIKRAFDLYGGPRGVQTTVPTRSGYAFVEFETEQQCDLAFQKLKGNFPYELKIWMPSA